MIYDFTETHLQVLPDEMAISIYSHRQNDYTLQERVMKKKPKSPFKCPGASCLPAPFWKRCCLTKP